MYKILILLLFMGLFSTHASAKEIKQHINIGINNSKIDLKTGTGLDISYGVNVVWDNGILVSFDMNYGEVSIQSSEYNKFGGDIKLGYRYKDVALYAIGSAIHQNYHNKDAAGFGAGLGIEYTPFKHLGIGADYKSYSMTSSIKDYDFEVSVIYLKIIF